MNYKERFISSIDEYKKVQKDLQVESEKFNQAGAHLEDEVDSNTKRLEKLLQEEYEKLKTSLASILKEKKEKIGATKETDLAKDYQLRLTNLLTAFKKDGAKMSQEMIVKGIILFTQDPMALSALSDTLIEVGRDRGEVEELIPLDKTDLTIAKLDSIKKSLNSKSKVSLKVDTDGYLGYEPFLNMLDEDFNYVG